MKAKNDLLMIYKQMFRKYLKVAQINNRPCVFIVPPVNAKFCWN